MNEYYNVTVKVETEVDTKKGPKIKFVTEKYLISAVSPTDAEAKMTEHLSGLMADFSVTNIAVTKIIDVIN